MKNSKIFPFERNKYYLGKLLSVEDFKLEQKYVNDKRRMINSFVLGTGVVAGMYVVQIDERTISVEKGFALDGSGREIVIESPEIKKLSLVDGFDSCVRSGNDSYMYLCVEYSEVEKNPVHNIAGTTGAPGESFNRIREGYRLYLTNDEPENEVMAPMDLYEQKKTVYWDGKVRITQIMPRYVRTGEQFEILIEVENLDKQYVAFSYDLLLTCLSSDNQSVLRVSFDEMLYEKKGKYTQAYKLHAQQYIDVEGIAEIDPKSFQLTLGKTAQPIQAEGKSVTYLAEKDTLQQLVTSYYKSAMGGISAANNENLYLAKIFLLKAGDTYLIENIENVPFGQYVLNNSLSAVVQQLLAQRPGHAIGIADGLVEAAATGMEKPLKEIASGTKRIHFNAGGRKGERFFSDEIVHGLGLGSVTIMLGVSEANSMTFGSMEVFEKQDPMAELAGRLNPAKGTFVIGARLIANTTKDFIDVKWTAIRDVEEIIEEKTKMKIFIKPNTLVLKTRESHYLEAVCSNMQDKTIHWSAVDNGGMIDSNGLYVAPNVPGVYEVVAQSAAYPEIKASIIIVVRD